MTAAARPPATIAKSVLAAWELLKQQVTDRHGQPRIAYGPTWKQNDNGGPGRRVGAVWFVDISGRPRNHNLSITEYGSADSAIRWDITAGRHGGILYSVEFAARGVFPVELLRTAAEHIGLLPPANTDAEDLATLREIAARANDNAEPIDPGVILDIVGWPSGESRPSTPLTSYPS